MSDTVTDVATLRHLAVEIEATNERLADLGAQRRRIVVSMRERMPVSEIRRITGMSTARIYQMLSDATT